ncbi:trypco2 family protein [Caballeronia ptereochthonis]|uniref:Trypsin-co-occurring domain-containing protein n=1 Tax=Caballeronia ptereochthonis TaxID=1777144 RepID=A0A158B8J9_9BURK|nr:trypco2 family protein [Caballeronia ptereochthonis]SAK66086.1 hypothetical protein AWB83_02918 [Caballeronia ptereochthonis]
MNESLRVMVAAFLLVVGVHANAKRPAVPEGPPAEIESVLNQVQQALANVQSTLAESNLPPLSEVKLDLQTVVKVKVGGGVTLWVISVGGHWEQDKAQQVVLTLKPPSPGAERNVASASLTQTLEETIVSAAKGVKDAEKSRVPLKPSALDLTLQFTVETNVNADVGPKITPITADFSGDVTKTAIQKLTVSFAYPKTPGK